MPRGIYERKPRKKKIGAKKTPKQKSPYLKDQNEMYHLMMLLRSKDHNVRKYVSMVLTERAMDNFKSLK